MKHKIWNQTSGWGSNYDCKRQWRWRFNVRPSSRQILHRRTIAFLDTVRVRVASDGTRKMAKYARRRWSQRKLCYTLVVILTCKWIIVFFVSLAVFPFVKFAILTGEHFGVADKILAILLLIFFDISGLLKALLLLCDSAVLLFRYICYFCEIYSC